MIEANSKETNELVVSKKELESLLSIHKVVENIQKLKQELIQFLNFDELTPEILHRLMIVLKLKPMELQKFFIDSPLQKLNKAGNKSVSCLIFSQNDLRDTLNVRSMRKHINRLHFDRLIAAVF
jgi:F0F1-type ATP synthase beta subunit